MEERILEISTKAQCIAKEIAIIAAKHKLYRINGEFNLSGERICFRWEDGRHGATSNRIHLSSERTLMVTCDIDNWKG